MTKECEFSKGSCIYCGDTAQGECEGWNLPPKREWVGLTDDERAECWSSSAKQSALNIEAKLKELNHD